MKRLDLFLKLLLIVIPKHLLLLAAITETARAQTPSFQWATRVASTINEDTELSIGLAIDGMANIYVTSWFDGTNDFGGVTLTNTPGGGQDIFVAKYSSNGALQWARRAGGDIPNSPDRDTEGRDNGRGIGVDNAGNVYVAGGFFGDADFDGFTLSGSTTEQFFLAKFDSVGMVEWVEQSQGGRDFGVYGTGLAVDSAGNCYTVGFADNGTNITFGTTNLLNPSLTGYSTFLVKYDNAGIVQWAQLMGGPGQTYATKVAVDATGNVYVRGSFSQNMTIGNSSLVAAVSEENMFIAKFDNSGVLTWVRQAEGGNVDEGGVAVDQTGNVFISGAFGSTVNFGGISLTNAGSLDAFVAKYNSTGAIQWARRAGGTNIDFYWDCTVDQPGNVYVGGVLSPGAVAPSGSGAMVAKYDSSGALQWANSASGPPASPVASLVTKCAVDSAGNCYLAGWYQNTATFGTTVLQPQGYWNFFLAKVGFAPLTLSIAWSNAMPWLSVSGEIGNRFALEYVPALPGNNNWQSLVTNTLTSVPLTIPDTTATGNSTRFYRAKLVP